ncbi:MAG: glycerophosphodiester phosphodiesterase [Bradyrhizobiaceae bacterium]|nr:glycerophosphodiester phosphodiesterase [Bradyrhizobiaceae bacterium]
MARPIAHRGLHDTNRGIIENTASAVRAAIEGRYGIEVDLQISSDGEAMVYHDDRLGRLTEGDERLTVMTAADLKRIRFRATSDRMLTLGELCDLVREQATLVLELKSAFNGDHRIALRTVDVLKSYRGAVAAMSFDPDLVATLKEAAPGLTRGITAMGRYDHSEWAPLSLWQRLTFPHLLQSALARPHFVAYALNDLPAVAPSFARRACGVPLLAWVARCEDDRMRATRVCDQIIFEDFQA